MVYQCKQVANMTPIHTVHIRTQSRDRDNFKFLPPLPHIISHLHYLHIPPPPITSSPHPSINLLPIFDFAKGNSIIEEVRRSPPKGQNCSDFQSCSESDVIYCAMQTIFCGNNIPLVFHKRGNKASNTFLKVPLPPASNSVHCIQHTCTVFWSQGSNCYALWRVDSQVILSLFFWLLEKNKHILDIL